MISSFLTILQRIICSVGDLWGDKVIESVARECKTYYLRYSTTV
jgi:hypothetical protein